MNKEKKFSEKLQKMLRKAMTRQNLKCCVIGLVVLLVFRHLRRQKVEQSSTESQGKFLQRLRIQKLS